MVMSLNGNIEKQVMAFQASPNSLNKEYFVFPAIRSCPS